MLRCIHPHPCSCVELSCNYSILVEDTFAASPRDTCVRPWEGNLSLYGQGLEPQGANSSNCERGGKKEAPQTR